jgi:phosphopantothenoylcysteine synthetase/decarboxylase
VTARPIAILTAGGTREAVDEVRHLTNLATGALPCAMAEALLARGWQVEYIHGPGAQLPGRPADTIDALAADWKARWQAHGQRLDQLAKRLSGGLLHLHAVTTAAEAAQALRDLCRAAQPELTLCAMAVADFAPQAVVGKLASRRDSLGSGPADPTGEALTLQLLPTPKAIDAVKQEAPDTWLLGFKLLAGADEPTLCAAAQHLARRSGADAVFANDVRAYQRGARHGLVVARDGAIIARLDGGQGAEGVERLAEQLVQLACRAARPVDPAADAATRPDLTRPY